MRESTGLRMRDKDSPRYVGYTFEPEADQAEEVTNGCLGLGGCTQRIMDRTCSVTKAMAGPWPDRIGY